MIENMQLMGNSELTLLCFNEIMEEKIIKIDNCYYNEPMTYIVIKIYSPTLLYHILTGSVSKLCCTIVLSYAGIFMLHE